MRYFSPQRAPITGLRTTSQHWISTYSLSHFPGQVSEIVQFCSPRSRSNCPNHIPALLQEFFRHVESKTARGGNEKYSAGCSLGKIMPFLLCFLPSGLVVVHGSRSAISRVVKPNDFRCRNHDRLGIAVLLHGRNQRSADNGPGHAEKVAASENSIRHVRQRHRSTR